MSAQEFHVAEFGTGLCHRLVVAVGEPDAVGFVECGQSLFLQTAEEMDQCLVEARQVGAVGDQRSGGPGEAGRPRGGEWIGWPAYVPGGS